MMKYKFYNVILRKMMILKSNVIAKGIIIACFLWGGIAGLHAQGVFSNDGSSASTVTPSAGGGLFRTDEDDLPPGSGGTGDDKKPDTGEPSPIGEGILILSLFSGAYAVIKRNRRNKYED